MKIILKITFVLAILVSTACSNKSNYFELKEKEEQLWLEMEYQASIVTNTVTDPVKHKKELLKLKQIQNQLDSIYIELDNARN